MSWGSSDLIPRAFQVIGSRLSGRMSGRTQPMEPWYMLCPSLLTDIKTEYSPHIVNEDFMLNFFVDLDFLLRQPPDAPERNLLCVYRNPSSHSPLPAASVHFEMLGFDLVASRRLSRLGNS
jgi:hypothetical protein